MTTQRIFAITLLTLAPAMAVCADQAPPPPQDVWKNEIFVGGLYGKNSGIVSAERWETWGQYQAGAGYRRLRPEIIDKDATGVVISRTPLEATGDAIATVGLDFSHTFTKTTVFTNKFLIEAGSSNTLLRDGLALTVKMSDKLALSVGYGIKDNTKPPAPLKKLDTVASVNLVFGF
jgi:putative salt-induced outer membrane protein YdiY